MKKNKNRTLTCNKIQNLRKEIDDERIIFRIKYFKLILNKINQPNSKLTITIKLIS